MRRAPDVQVRQAERLMQDALVQLVHVDPFGSGYMGHAQRLITRAIVMVGWARRMREGLAMHEVRA